jgi:hypothetical protein
LLAMVRRSGGAVDGNKHGVGVGLIWTAVRGERKELDSVLERMDRRQAAGLMLDGARPERGIGEGETDSQMRTTQLTMELELAQTGRWLRWNW